jgi:hypothetical protein
MGVNLVGPVEETFSRLPQGVDVGVIPSLYVPKRKHN